MFVWLLQESWAMDPWSTIAVYETETAAVDRIKNDPANWKEVTIARDLPSRYWSNGMGDQLCLRRMQVLK